MGRKPVELNPVRGKRLMVWMKEQGITQSRLGELSGYTPQTISGWWNGKANLTEDAIDIIVRKQGDLGIKREEQIRKEWLMGLDDYKTEHDYTDNVLRDVISMRMASDDFISMCANREGWSIKKEFTDRHEEIYCVSGIDFVSGAVNGNDAILEIPAMELSTAFLGMKDVALRLFKNAIMIYWIKMVQQYNEAMRREKAQKEFDATAIVEKDDICSGESIATEEKPDGIEDGREMK